MIFLSLCSSSIPFLAPPVLLPELLLAISFSFWSLPCSSGEQQFGCLRRPVLPSLQAVAVSFQAAIASQGELAANQPAGPPFSVRPDRREDPETRSGGLAMDWDAKMLPPWDLGTVVGPSSGVGVVAAAGASGGGGALDLKLGGPTSWRAGAATAPAAAPLPPRPSSSAPAKRPRAGQAQQAVPACSVEGCAADLSKGRDYHRRHKVCEAHSKTPVVTVAGQQQRFCQQCSRFAPRTSHALYLFLDSFIPFKLMILFWFLAQIIQSEL